ncbi:hypothetical protein GW17_00023416 [Ensete ventricosum]|nr:hypothetical protein GW17_00023416 [Ensete ventricosum]
MMLSLLSDARQQPQQHPAPPQPSPAQHPPPFGSGGGGGLGFLKGSLGELEEASDLLQSVDAAVDVKSLPRSKSDEAHQNYKAAKYKQALEYGNALYERNPRRKDNLLLLGAIYYQVHDYDMCIARNEEALGIDPHFAECYGNMANAWKEKGNVDLAIRYYLTAIEAYKCYLEALRIQPTFAIAWSNLAGLFMEAGDLNKALIKCVHTWRKVLLMEKNHSSFGLFQAMGMPQEAIMCYRHAVQARPNYAMAYG